MPQEHIDSVNIKTFGFTTMLDLANRKMVFDIAELTEFKDNGGANIVGINFSLNDASNNPLIPGNPGNLVYDWTHPNITDPSTNANPNYSGASSVEVDLVEIFGNNYTAIFQNFRIQGAIKDADGKVYETTALIKGAPMPPGFTDLGYVPGKFAIEADCQNGYLSVHETTNLTYCGKVPLRQNSNGTLYYPRGTVDPIPFAFTSPVAFTNNVVYTGNYKVINTTTAVYDSGLDFFVQVEYYTESEAFDITCEKNMLSVMCCLEDFQQNMLRNCSGAQYEAMHDKWTEAGTLLAIGLAKENAGKDATAEAQKIRKLLNCNCTSSSINRISPNPVNPMIYSITMQGKNGTTVTPSTAGNTKTFDVSSNVYQVVKGVPSDLSFSIETNTSIPGIVKYILTFDYDKLAQKVGQYINAGDFTIGQSISLCSIDYNGDKVSTAYPANTPLGTFLQAVASVGCDVVNALAVILSLDADSGLNFKTINGVPTIRWGGDLKENTIIGNEAYWVHIKNNVAIGPETPSIADNSSKLGVVRYGGIGKQAIAANMTMLTNTPNTVDNYMTAAINAILYAYLNNGPLNVAASTIVSAVVARLSLALSNAITGGEISALNAFVALSNGSLLGSNNNNVEDLVAAIIGSPMQAVGGNNYTGTIARTTGLLIRAQQGYLPGAIQTLVYAIRQLGANDLNYFAGKMAIGTLTPDATAKLQVDSTTQGFLVPRMTTAQINAIVNPASSLVVFDTDLGALKIYINGWKIIATTGGWLQSTNLSTALFQPAGSVFNQLYNYVVGSNSIIFDFSVGVTTTAAGFIVIKITLPIAGIANRKFHSWSNIAGSAVDCTVNLNANDPYNLTLSALSSVPAGTYYFNGQITYQWA